MTIKTIIYCNDERNYDIIMNTFMVKRVFEVLIEYIFNKICLLESNEFKPKVSVVFC